MKTRRTGKSLLALLCAAMLTALVCPVSLALADEGAAPVAETDGQQYASLAEAVVAAAPGSTVTLLNDCEVDAAIGISKKLAVDLNGKTVNGVGASIFQVLAGGDLSLGSTAEGEAGEIAADGSMPAILVGEDGDAGSASATIDCATVTSASGNAVLLNSGSLLVKDGAAINGATGVYVRGGEATIEGGVICGNGPNEGYDSDAAAPTGDALVVDNHGGLASDPKVSVTGGEFSSKYAQRVASFASGGKDSVLGFVYGGSFDGYVNPNYVADGLVQFTHGSHVEVCKEQASASDASGKTVGAVVIPSSSFAPKLSVGSAQALADIAARAAASLGRGNGLPAGFEMSGEDLARLNNVAGDAGEDDALSLVLSVEVEPTVSTESAQVGEENGEDACGLDVSVYADLAVRDANGWTKAGGSVAVTGLPVAFELTVTMPEDFPLSGRDVRLVRRDGNSVELVPATVDKDANAVTFSTDMSGSYAVLATEQTPEVVTRKVSFVDKANGTASVAEVEDGKAVAKPADPSFAEYEFAGWFVDEGATTLYDFDAPVTGDLTLYAGYKKAVAAPSAGNANKGTDKAPVFKPLPQTGDSSADAWGVAVLGAVLLLGACAWSYRSQR